MCWIDRTTSPLKGPLVAPLKSFICFLASAAQHGCGAQRGPNWQTAWKTSTCECSFSFLTLEGSRGERLCYNRKRESEREKKKTLSFFFPTAEFFVVQVSKRMRLDMKYSNLSGRTWGRASSTCGWKRFVNSWWRNRGAQTQVRLGEWMVDRHLLYQAVVTQGWVFIDLCFYRLVLNQWEQEADDGWHRASSLFNSTTLTRQSII